MLDKIFLITNWEDDESSNYDNNTKNLLLENFCPNKPYEFPDPNKF